MAVMRWTEKMSVGVPELDADHKELIKVINQLRENSAAAARGTAVRQCLFALAALRRIPLRPRGEGAGHLPLPQDSRA